MTVFNIFFSLLHLIVYGSVHSNCTDGEVRLFGGRTEYEGTVEVCLNNAWMTISRTYNSHDYLPKILCRTLGFNISGKVTVTVV